MADRREAAVIASSERRPAPGDDGVAREQLTKDPAWAAYALGDLDERRARHCQWFIRDGSIALLYREFAAPIFWAAGDPAILEDVPDLAGCDLQIPEPFLEPIQARIPIAWTRPMFRMVLDERDFQPGTTTVAVDRLDSAQAADVRALYADGVARHEEPDFFFASQMDDRTFFGVRSGGALVAAGGTHLYSEAERVGTIGNVYTHHAHRGRGYAAAVTTAIVRELISRGMQTLALNVKRDNAAAIHVYETLGFRIHCPFLEGRTSTLRLG